MKISICHLFPDVLNLYGDRGNIICMRRRLEARGFEVCVTDLTIGRTAPFSEFDLFFVGGGQDFEQEALMADLEVGKAAEIRAAVADGAVFLAICGGYQMLGNYYKTWDGHMCDFVGALDLHTVGQRERLVGNYMFRCAPESGGAVVVGFENHSGKTYLGPGVAPLGEIIAGHGNNGEDGTEGARYNNVFCSYSHGPVLPKNPALADAILAAAVDRRYPGTQLAPLDDALESAAHDQMARRLAP